ncbi:MAG: dienelactone hydrolase family protein [Solirubrobacteraceae bacterium]
MSSETIEVQTADGVADAYLVKPDGEERYPGVLLIVDAFGLRSQIEKMADRIAAHGFTVLTPNVFYRAGRAPVVSLEGMDDPDRRGELLGKLRPLMDELTPERIERDGEAYLSTLEEAGRGPIAITGYCMGGRVGWRIATAFPGRVAALAAFHAGGLVTEGQDSPHVSAGKLYAEVYLGHADNDPSMTRESIATLEQALQDAGIRYRSELYEGAGHGYTMADTPVYDEAAAERHFKELFDLLDRTIVG